MKIFKYIQTRFLGYILVSLLFTINPLASYTFSQTESSINDSLIIAVRNGNIEIIKAYISQGANVNTIEKQTKLTPLHICAQNVQIDILKLLLDAGALPNIEDQYGRTPDECTKDIKIQRELINSLSPDIRSKILNDDIENSCFKIAELKPAKPSRRPLPVSINNGNMFIYISRYNTTGIQLTGGQSGLESKGGLPGGAGNNFVYCFIGKSIIITPKGQRIVFEDLNVPLNFVLTSKEGLVYLRGEGQVTLADNRIIKLPCDKSE
jgi:hypothetical protein